MRCFPAVFACWTLIAFGLSGCASWQEKSVTPPSLQARQMLYDLNAWTLEGRIAAKTGNEGWNANLSWEHLADEERVRLSGPFNQGAVSIVLGKDQISISEADGSTTRSDNPDELLKTRLGFAVPLRSLRFWVLGLPAQNSAYTTESDAAGGLLGFEQEGWTLRYDSFESVKNFVLPRKMTIRGNDASLKLIADEWVVNQ